MDRRKLRRLLASSSFAALLVAAEQARGQDLTNPAGSVFTFLQVTAADIFDDVINFGTLTGGGTPEVGIEVEGGGTVNGRVSNDGLIDIDETAQATGIRVDGSGAFIGEGIHNHGSIDLDVVHSNIGVATGLVARGIAVEGTNNEVQQAIDNDDGGVIDIFLRGVHSVAGATVTAKVGGTATGIFVGKDVTLSGGVINAGLIDIIVSNTARALADHSTVAIANAKATASAFGMRLTAATLDGGVINRNEGTIEVIADNQATADATVLGGGTAEARADVTGFAVGIDVAALTITGGVNNDGALDVAAFQFASASALVTAGLPNGSAVATANAEADAIGIRVDSGFLGPDADGIAFQNDGEIFFVDAEATGSAYAQVNVKSTARATAKAFAEATARGIQLDIDTIVGDFENEGLVDVRAAGLMDVEARATALIGIADAKARAHDGRAFALGVEVDGTQITGDIVNAGIGMQIFADATLTAKAVAFASAQGNNSALAKAVVESNFADASGLAIGIGTVFGNVFNDGTIAANARMVVVADASAQASNDFAEAKARVQDNTAFALGVGVGGPVTISGSVTNSADITARAWIGGAQTVGGAITTGVTAFASGETAKARAEVFTYEAFASGFFVGADTIGGDLSNDGSVNAFATANVKAVAIARADAGKARAEFSAEDVTADARGIFFNGDTVEGDSHNSGRVQAHALLVFDAFATATSTANKAAASARAENVFVNATGLDMNYDTVRGSVVNSGDVTATAKLDGADSLDAAAKAAKDQATATAFWTDAEASAVAMRVSASTIGGNLENAGELRAIASGLLGVHAAVSASTAAKAFAELANVDVSATAFEINVNTLDGDSTNSGDLHAQALAQLFVSASAVSAKSKALATALMEQGDPVNVEAYGLDHHVDTVFGNVTNSGDITVSGKIDAAGTVLGAPTQGFVAIATGGEAAAAKASFLEASISVTGFHAPFDTITGNLVNEGAVYALGSADLWVLASAKATSKADAKAKLADLEINVFGVNFDGDTVGGDVSNHGYVHATGVARIVVSALASSTSDKAGAKATVTDVSVNAVGLTIDIDTISGSVFNDAGITAKALLNAGSSVKAVATGTEAKADAKWEDIDLTATAFSIDVDTVNGDITNDGELWALAHANVAVSAIANATTGKAEAKAKASDIDVDVRGLDIDIEDTLFGNLLNEGAIHATGVATLDVHASAISTNSKADAKATATDVDIEVIALLVEADQDHILGSVTNNGNLTAIAQLNSGDSVKAFASGTEAKAEAKFVTAAEITAVGMDVTVESIGGSFLNAGNVWAQATANINVDATANATGKADAKAQATDISISAYGLRVDIETLEGNFTNSGDITVRGQLDITVDAKAVSTNGDEAKAKASIVDISMSTIVGISVTGTSFRGDLTNSGDISAIGLINSGSSVKAVATGADAKAEALFSDVTVNATAFYLQVDTVLGDIENSGALSGVIRADFNVVASASATAGKADAKAKLTNIDLSAYGMYATPDSVGGSFINSGDVLASASATVNVLANATATGKAGAKASAAGSISIYALALYVDSDTIVGSLTNTGDLTAVAKLNSGSSVKAFADGSEAKAEAKFVSGGDVTATGMYVTVTSVGGSFLNEGAVWAQATGSINVAATANATAGKADAKALVSDPSINAVGIYVDIETLDGDFTNHGDITARAELDIEVGAKAVSTGDEAKAKATVTDVSVTATGLSVTGTTWKGSVLNSGDIDAIALINSGSSVKAIATGVDAKATAVFSSISLDVSAFFMGVDTVDGDVVNSGALTAIAKGAFNVVASASGTGGKAEAKALFSQGGFGITAIGASVTADTIGGSFRNSGDVYVLASGVIEVVANATASADAKAKATAQDVTAVATGIVLDVGTVFGSVTNSGGLTVVAKLVGPSSIKAFASGADAKAEAKFQSGTASLVALSLSANTVFGDFLNEGDILALASVNGLVSAKAIASATDADAKAKAVDLVANATGIFVSLSQLGSSATTFGGDFRNSGDITVSGIVNAVVDASAVATLAGASDAKAKATAENLKAEVYGINVPYTAASIFGSITNSAQILVLAQVDALVSADALGNNDVDAEAKAHNISAKAYGIRLSEGDTLAGGLLNTGWVQVSALVDATASAAASDSAKAKAENVKAKAAGLAIEDWDTVDGGFTNSGTLLVTADAFAKAVASGSTEDAKAKAKATGYGMRVEGSTTLTGGMLNAGTITVNAKAVASASGSNEDAKADAKAYGMQLDINSLFGDMRNDGLIDVNAFASAVAATATAKAKAYGMLAEVTGVASGSLINAGTILVNATANAPAEAFGQVIEGGGTWTGALSNATDGFQDIFASDTVKATAIGMAIRGTADVEGGVINAGTVLAEAVSTGTAIARAIDLSEATGTGHRIQMLDGLLRAITRSTALAASNVATAVYMKDNTQLDTLDWSGGLIEANIIGDQASDIMNVFAGKDDVFNHEHLIDGLLALNVNTAGQAATPVEFRIGGTAQNIEDLNVNENGTLVVGVNAAATLAKISANTYTQDPDGTVIFEILPGNNNNGVITVNNTAFLDGTIGIRPQAGLYFNTQTYLAIDGVLAGSFDNTFSHSPLLSLAVEDTSPDVILTVTRNAFASVPGLTENQSELGEALDDFYDPVALLGTEIGDEVIAQLFPLSTDELLDAYDDLHGAEHAQMAYAGFQAMDFVLSGVNQRLHDGRSVSSGGGQSASLGNQSLQYAQIRSGDEGVTGTQLAAVGNTADQPGSVWGKGFGSFGTVDGDDEAPGYDSTTGAIVVGFDYQIDEQFLIGIVGAYAFSSIDFDDGDDGDVDSWQIGLFGSWDSGTWYVDGLVSYAFQGYETTRHIDFIDEKAEGDYDGGAVQVYGEVGYQFQVGQQGLITPLLGLGWTNVWTDEFTETGAGGANLTVDQASYESLATTLGIRGSLALDGWEPSLFLGWRHEFLDDHGEADVAFAAVPGSEWQVIGSEIGSDSGLVGVGVVAEISEQFEATIDYGGQFSGSGSNHTGSIGIRFKF